MKLPLRFVDNVTEGYVVKDANSHIIAARSAYEYDNAPLDSDIKQIVQACNSFPEAVKLLKEYLKRYSDIDDITEQTEQFLTKLEEDDKDIK